MPYYSSMTLATVMLVFGLSAKPDTDIRTWARKEAQAVLAAEAEEE